MRKTTRRLLPAGLALLASASAFGAVSASGPRRLAPVLPPPGSAGLTTSVAGGPIVWFVELQDPPAAAAWADEIDAVGDREAVTSGVLARARAAAQFQLDVNRAAQAAVAPRLSALGAREIYRVSRALNGIAVLASPEQAAALGRVPGVRSVRPIEPEVLHNRTSVPYIGAPQVWASTTPVPAGLKGQGMTIGIIDTGIDYMHGDFGGTGVLADYQQAAADTASWTTNPRSGAGRFPTNKVVGGRDFAGDAYGTTSTVPAPDPNPMDCHGHGSHVAGTAAGFGVTAAGATYSGAYNPTDPYSTAPRIGPGVAPEAQLYALRVFGCGGSTTLTAQAIDWSIDPNGDGDFSDHLDVINMSLGASYGGPSDLSAAASDNAARAGVVVVASAGNSGDTYFVSGSPAAGGRVIAVANVTDPGGGAVLQVNSPPASAGTFLAGVASFGPNLADGSVTGDLSLTDDGAGSTIGCAALVGFPAGRVAVIDRGTCSFKTKALNAQNAGAIGVVIVNNAAGDPPGLGDDATITTPITIPSISVTNTYGATLKAAIAAGTVNATLASAGGGINSSSSRGPRAGIPIRLKPDVAAPGTSIPSVQTGRTCTAASGGCITPDATGYRAGNVSLTISGTSMSAPHVSGVMALLRQLHPDWSVEQLKALVMTTSLRDVFQYSGGLGNRIGIGRVGAGQVDVPSAAAGTVVAFGLDERGQVSVSFDGEAAGTARRTRTVALWNHGAAPVTLDLSLVVSVDAPGVAFSLPQTTITVPAHGYNTFPVVMDADASEMTLSADPSVAATQAGLSRFRLAEEAAYLEFHSSVAPVSSNGDPLLRLPVYAALRPVGAGEAAGPIATGGAAAGTGAITLAGTGLCTGTLTSGACTGTFPADRASLVSAFELQGASPKSPSLASDGWEHADLKYAGIQYDATNGLVVFGLATWASWATPAQVVFDVLVDGNNDGTFEKVLLNPRWTSGSLPTDLFIAGVSNTTPYSPALGQYLNLYTPAQVDTGLWGTNVVVIAATPAQLGITVGQPFQWKVASCPGFASTCGLGASPTPLDVLGPFTWNTAAQGLDLDGLWGMDDQPGATLPVTWNTANFATNGTLGALLVHHLNGEGTRAEPVLVQTDAVNPPASADLAVAVSTPLAVVQRLATSTVTVQVSNAGPTAATGVVVHVPLPSGLAWVSDDGGLAPTVAGLVANGPAPAYDPSSGAWTVGTLASGASQTLTVTFEGRTSGPYLLLGEVADAQPIDTHQGDNRSVVPLTVREDGETAAGGYFTLVPCRVIDTREANGPYGGPALGAGAERVVAVAGRCGVPSTAKAVAANVTVIDSTGTGFVRAYASFPAQVPTTSTVNFVAGATRANNAIVGVNASGQLTLQNGMKSGLVHVVLDVVGYFE